MKKESSRSSLKTDSPDPTERNSSCHLCLIHPESRSWKTWVQAIFQKKTSPGWMRSSSRIFSLVIRSFHRCCSVLRPKGNWVVQVKSETHTKFSNQHTSTTSSKHWNQFSICLPGSRGQRMICTSSRLNRSDLNCLKQPCCKSHQKNGCLKRLASIRQNTAS